MAYVAREVEGLIKSDRHKEAVAKAKQLHRSLQSPEAEKVLATAYVARAETLHKRGLREDAQALMTLAVEEYPFLRLPMEELSLRLTVLSGSLDDLIGPLAKDDLPPEQRRTIEAVLRKELVDPRALASSPALPADHPLRTGAAALVLALEAITTGRKGDIALTEISRRGPLAPWKMLVSALDGFYRQEDKACRRFLEAIDPASPPARLIPAIKTMLGEGQADLTPPALDLVREVSEAWALRKALEPLDEAFDRGDTYAITMGIQLAVKMCGQINPDFLTQLKQHIAVVAQGQGMPYSLLLSAMEGPPLRNAHFWHLSARFHEENNEPLRACFHWEEFRIHAIHEGWLSDKGPALAALYLNMARRLRTVPPRQLSRMQKNWKNHAPSLRRESYRDQPPSLQAVAKRGPKENSDLTFLSPERLYALACDNHPVAELFAERTEWLQEAKYGWKVIDEAAQAWLAALPRDSRPLLALMASAEGRGAFKKALGYLERAEALDGLNPQVRRARLRLHVSIAIRHLKEKKLNLLSKDIAQMESLPQMKDGDRMAFLHALRWAGCRLSEDSKGVAQAQREMERILGGPVASTLLLHSLLEAAVSPHIPLPEGSELMDAVSRACLLAEDMALPIRFPKTWVEPLMQAVSTPGPLDDANLRIIAEVALDTSEQVLAYKASGAGLAQGRQEARFLLLRSQSLPFFTFNRKVMCLMAALQLAQQQRDMELVEKIINHLHYLSTWTMGPLDGSKASQLLPEKIREIIQQEREATDFPKSNSDDFGSSFSSLRPSFRENDYEDDLDDEFDEDEEPCNCPRCRAQRGEFDEDDLPEGIPLEFIEMLNDVGVPNPGESIKEVLLRLMEESRKAKSGPRRGKKK